MSLPVRTGIPSITTDQMREVDRIMLEDLGIALLQMMENAGRTLALLAVELFEPSSVVVVAGPGGNGGGGLVAGRHLANRGVDVSVVLSRQDLSDAAVHQAHILEKMGVAFSSDPVPADVAIDAVIGYSILGDPRGRSADLIAWMNDQTAPVVALDTPSGLDPTTGTAGAPTTAATATMTLALPKLGLTARPDLVGDLYLADISVPPGVYERFGITLDDPFSGSPVVRIGEG